MASSYTSRVPLDQRAVRAHFGQKVSDWHTRDRQITTLPNIVRIPIVLYTFLFLVPDYLSMVYHYLFMVSNYPFKVSKYLLIKYA